MSFLNVNVEQRPHFLELKFRLWTLLFMDLWHANYMNFFSIIKRVFVVNQEVGNEKVEKLYDIIKHIYSIKSGMFSWIDLYLE